MKKLLYSLLLIIFLTPCFIYCYGETEVKHKKVLVLGSYCLNNEWEIDVLKGLKTSFDSNTCLYTEFLDSKSANFADYIDKFISLLNSKYHSDDIDCIITIDDEALHFVRSQLPNEKSVFYKKPVIFIGYNNSLSLNEFEKEHITGILEYQDNLLAINTILKSKLEISDIYILLDNNIYSKTIKSNVESIINTADREFNLHIIQDDNFSNVLSTIHNINPNTSAIYLCGTYINPNEDNILSSKFVIEEIQDVTKAPIYTKLSSYVKAGAIGGFVNDGEALGSMTSSLINRIFEGDSISQIIPIYNTLNIPYFNFNAIRKYKVNPLILPQNSIYINKGHFDLLLPLWVEYTIWLVIALSIILAIYMIIIFIKNKKKTYESHRLLLETIERNNIKTDFILTLSHELRTPLNVIVNSTKLIEHRLGDEAKENDFYTKHLKYITKNSKRLIKLVNNLIDASKLDSGYMNTSFTMENIVEIIEDVTLSVVDLAKSHGIEIIFDTYEEEIITAIDKGKMERIMLNLLSNSIKFSKENGQIFVFLTTDWKYIQITVKDNGIGMSKDLLDHLFQKFKREESTLSLKRNSEGSGLGLFIVKGLIELHKGTIHFDSKVNVGTKVTISLPITQVEMDAPNVVFMNNSLVDTVNLELSDVD